ncbi:hypothetical protein TWF281_004346 [Arthrobotrys megalospora]
MASVFHPWGASAIYQEMHKTTIKFFESMGKSHRDPKPIDIGAIKEVRTENFRQTFGFRYGTSSEPSSKEALNVYTLIKRLEEEAPLLSHRVVTIQEIMVDDWRRRAMARVAIELCAKGDNKQMVRNETVWILELVDEGKKVSRAVVFEDAIATDTFEGWFISG